MKPKPANGLFEVIDSFAIRKRNEFYLIGQTKEGVVEENWFVNVPLNAGLSLTLKISGIEEIEMTRERNKNYTLLMVRADPETLDLLLGLDIGSELLDITIHGQD